MTQVKQQSTQEKYHLNGKEINLTSDNTTIVSDNFNVDKFGNMSCKSATINNGDLIITSDGLIKQVSNDSGLQLLYMEDNDYKSYMGANNISLKFKNGSGGIDISLMDEAEGNTSIYNHKIYTPSVQITGAGTVMHGKNTGNTYQCNWTGSQLQFFVDATNVGTLSDVRLKNEIKDIDEDLIKAVEEIEMKQFKIVNRNGLVSFGILAQDLIEIFKKYKKNPFEYEIVQQTQYKTDDDTIYYTIDYVQFLVLKQLATNLKIDNLVCMVNELQKEIEKSKKESE